jgi:hypothetical protein
MYIMFRELSLFLELEDLARSRRRRAVMKPSVKEKEFRSEELYVYKRSY